MNTLPGARLYNDVTTEVAVQTILSAPTNDYALARRPHGTRVHMLLSLATDPFARITGSASS
jgi:hypothetical protein